LAVAQERGAIVVVIIW